MALEKVGLRAVFETAEFQRGVTIYNNGIVQVNNYAKQAEQQSKKSSKATEESWTQSFKTIAKNVAIAIAAYKALERAMSGVMEATKLAARVEMLGVAMETVGKVAGQSAEQMRGHEEAIKEQGITTQAARQILLQMAQAQIDFAAASDVARVAQDAAVIANINSSEAAQRLIYAIQSANVRVARTIGLNVSWQRSYERMAAQLGKTTDDLTEQEQVQARVNEVMRVGARITGTYEAALETAGKKATSLARYQEESLLILGNVFKESYGLIIEAQTEALKGFQRWAEENEEGLDRLSQSFAALTEESMSVAQSLLALTDTDLTSFLDKLTEVTDKIGEALYYLKQWIAFAHAGAEMYREAGKAAVEELWESITTGGQRIEDAWGAIATRAADKYEETLLKHYPPAAEKVVKETQEAMAEALEAPEVPEYYTKAAQSLTEHLDKLQKLQRDHYRRLADLEARQNRAAARAERQFQRSLEKARQAGLERLEDITEHYEKRRAETIEDAEKRITEAEADIYKDRERAQRDYERRRRQQEERYRLDRLQSERRYQYNYARLLAEGDALALYYLQQERELERQEEEENQALQQKQAKENYEAQIKDMEESARELIEELRRSLQEQLAEQEAAYQEQIAKQKEANAERLAEMLANYEEQQALQAEQDAEELRRQEENYRRQLEDLGRSLRDQEELQEIGAEEIRRILEEYYGEGGIVDEIMRGYYERQVERAVVTAETLASLAATTTTAEALTAATEYYPMQRGGILRGPAWAFVEPGMVEAFIPLARGASVNVGGNIGVNVSGLERAMPSLVNQVAAQVGTRIFTDLTSEIRTRRQAR